MSRKRRHNIPLLVAVILLILTLLSMRLTGGLFARYRSVSSGSDAARVAKFDVAVDVQEVADTTNQFTVSIVNNSEVAVMYSIVVEVDRALKAVLDDAEGTVSGNKVTFTNDNWTLGPEERTNPDHKLVFSVIDWTYITQNGSGNLASKDSSFTVYVTAEQID